jgi:hypothetical protein
MGSPLARMATISPAALRVQSALLLAVKIG